MEWEVGAMVEGVREEEARAVAVMVVVVMEGAVLWGWRGRRW